MWAIEQRTIGERVVLVSETNFYDSLARVLFYYRRLFQIQLNASKNNDKQCKILKNPHTHALTNGRPIETHHHVVTIYVCTQSWIQQYSTIANNRTSTTGNQKSNVRKKNTKKPNQSQKNEKNNQQCHHIIYNISPIISFWKLKKRIVYRSVFFLIKNCN